MKARLRDSLVLAAWTGFLVATLAALHALGGGALATPPLRGVRGWLDGREASTALFAVLRVALLGAGWYLLGATLLATALRLLRADAAAGTVEAWTPGPVRRLVRAAAGLSIAASVVAASASAASEADEPVTMRRLPDAGMQVVDASDGLVTMTRLPDDTPPPPPAPATWTVAPGDHLWSIAARSLRPAWGRTPTDDEVDPYWRLLIAQNRGRLADPTNPDLIHPDLELVLPPLPPIPDR